MDPKIREALREYAMLVKEQGWEAGEPLVATLKKRIPDFDKWALAMRLMLRADEILDEEKGTRPLANSRRSR